jgi:hypothetical protein
MRDTAMETTAAEAASALNIVFPKKRMPFAKGTTSRSYSLARE